MSGDTEARGEAVVRGAEARERQKCSTAIQVSNVTCAGGIPWIEPGGNLRFQSSKPIRLTRRRGC